MKDRNGGPLKDVVRSGLWLYVGSIVDYLQGFIYWIIMSSLVGPASLGVASAIAGLSSLVNSLLSLGIDVGVKRFFGIALGNNDKEMLIRYFWTSFTFTLLLYGSTSIAIALVGLKGIEIGGITGIMLIFTAFMVISGLGIIPSALIISLLKTEVIFIAIVVSIVTRFTVGLALVLVFGLGWVGVIIGNLTQLYTRLVLILLYSIRSVGIAFRHSTIALKDVIIAGIPSWLPGFITTIGSWLGVLSVYTLFGATETGYYYVAMTVSNVVLALPGSIMSIAFPVLSGMIDGRKRLTSLVLKLSLAFSAPVTVYLIVYPWLPLSLLGPEYVSATNVLRILMIAVFPTIITSAVSTLIYAYGNYLQVLLIGTSISMTRLIFYYMLVPTYGGLGSAIAYVIGSLIGLITSVYMTRLIELRLNRQMMVEIIGIPALVGSVCVLTNLHWFIALILLSTTYIAYLRLKIITKDELRELTKVIHLHYVVSRVYSRYKDLIDKFLGI